MATFFWHDYETFGATPKSDRPAQFAGVRTDEDLNEIGEPIMVYCKPTPECIPAPEACLITHLTPQECDEKGITEQAFAQIIEQALAEPGTIGVGFNSIRFDDEVTRYLFWRNLIDPYAREWKNECGRWDLLDVTRALYALKPHALTWPQNETGISFKLQDLSAANWLTHEQAHEALSDVRATIGLARLIKQAEPRFFEFCLKLRDKRRVEEELCLHNKRPLLHVSGMYPSAQGCLALVWPLATHPTNKNEIIVWDLAQDPSILGQLTAEEIRTRLFTRTTNLEEGIARLPIKTISMNKSPFVVNDLRVLKPARALELGIDIALAHQHADCIKDLKLPLRLWEEVYGRAPFEATDVDEDLYGGFIPNEDRSLLEKLRKMDGARLAKAAPVFKDIRLKTLFFRYRARNFPESLTDEETITWQSFCRSKRTEKMPQFLAELDRLAQTANESEKQILEKLKEWAHYG